MEAARPHLGFDIDGVVYKVDRLDWQSRLGFVTARRAGGSRAKFPASRRARCWRRSTSRWAGTGALTPVAR
jgi:DNA ligase (NAD+)